MESARIAVAGIFKNVAVAAGDADFSDDGEDDVLRGDAAVQFALDFDARGFRAELREALRGEHVLNFAGADAESERAQGAVRGSVAVAADNGEARLRDAEFRADDVHDALIAAVHVKEAHAGFAAIFGRGRRIAPAASASTMGRKRSLSWGRNGPSRRRSGRAGELCGPRLSVPQTPAAKCLRESDGGQYKEGRLAGGSATTWASQIFSYIVCEGIDSLAPI